jgi:hypothetical protein
MLTPELLDRLSSLSEADQIEIKRMMAAEESALWLPNAGPQTRAAFSMADILLYGGQAGGGKTDLDLGLAFTKHKRSLLMRRKYTDLSSLIDRAIEINGTRKGFNGAPPPKLRTKDGRLLQFGANQFPGDEQNFQGQPYDLKCVGRGTGVLMADGSYREIQDLVVGDRVATLEGGRRITRILPIRHAGAVRMEVRDAHGELVCSQDQSLTHEVLTRSGWVSRDTFDESFPSSTFAPIGWSEVRKLSGWFGLTSAVALRRLLSRPDHQMRIFEFVREILCSGHLVGWAESVFEGRQQLALGAAGSCGLRQAVSPLPGSFDLQGLLSQIHALCEYLGSLRILGSQVGDDRFSLVPINCRDDCSADCHPRGGRVRQPSDRDCVGGGDLFCLRQQCDVAQPSPIYFEDDGRGNTPKCSRHIGTYLHPYTKEIRSVGEGLLADFRSFEFREIGEIALYDIEVDEVNHYVTHGGVVNKNCFDEAVQFLETQVRFHLGWVRSADPAQRCRTILSTNPPISADGDWIINFFRPWLDVTHHNPAKAGELRWFITDDKGEDEEVDGPEPIQRGHRVFKPMSRTFIPASLNDNPYLARTDYQARLDSLPEPIRSAVRDGNFMAARADAEFQVIPVQWVLEAQARWTEDGHKRTTMTSMAVDPAGGGKDAEEIVCRYGGWFSKITTHKGKATEGQKTGLVEVFLQRKDDAPVIIDVGGGYAGVMISKFIDNNVRYQRFQGNSAGHGRAKFSGYPFANKRAEAWWRMREALDPNQDGGSIICLPPDPELRADLTAPNYLATALHNRGIIQIEDKGDLRARLGRSTGKGDVVVMALYGGDSIVEKVVLKGGSGELPQFAVSRSTGPLARYRSRRGR